MAAQSLEPTTAQSAKSGATHAANPNSKVFPQLPWTLTTTSGATIGTFTKLNITLTRLPNSSNMLISADYSFAAGHWTRSPNGAVPGDTGFSVQLGNGAAVMLQIDCGINGAQLIELWCNSGDHVQSAQIMDLYDPTTEVNVLWRAGNVQQC